MLPTYSAPPDTGCGVSGKEPRKAWKQAKKEIFENVKYGTWANDTYVSEPSDMGLFCSLGDIQKTLLEIDNVLNGARMFTFRPDGQVSLCYCQQPGDQRP